MKNTAFVSGFAVLLLLACPALKAQTGSARGSAGGSRVDFAFPALLSAGKYAVIPLPDQLLPVRLTDDGTVIFRKFGVNEIGYRWQHGVLSPLILPDYLASGYLPFPVAFQSTRTGWIMAVFMRMQGPPSTAVLVWPPGESRAVRLNSPHFTVEGFDQLLELALNPLLSDAGQVWAQVGFPVPDEQVTLKFAFWNALSEIPDVLDPNGSAVRAIGVNGSGMLIGNYTVDFEDPSHVRWFAGDVSRTVDFKPRLINDAGWVVGLRSNSPAPNVLWKDGMEVALPDGDIDEIDEFNNVHGHTPEGRHVMWTTDLKSRVSTPGGTSYRAIDYIPPILPAGWTSDVEVIPGDYRMRLGVGMYVDPATPLAAPESHPVLLVPAELALDANRDGTIKLAAEGSSDLATADNPFRFWINDDDDSGDTGGSDVSDAANSTPNYFDGAVNGTRDLVDFFPVFLDIKQLLAVLPADGFTRYRLKQADGAVNFVYSNLTRERALAYQKEILTTGFGDFFNQGPGMAATHQVTASGFELSPAFLAGVKDDNWGVILVEGRALTTAPLLLVAEKDGATIAEVELDLRLSKVEAMFRQVDLARVPTEYDGAATLPPEPVPASRTNDPGEPWPDRLTNGKYFVFIHGFNVDGQRARGWQSEVFKRLHVLGSKARFVGVTWNGATGLKIGGDYTDYHQAVFNAFQTGDALADALSFTVGADVTVAAHSLGNMVASQAIQSGGFAPARYFMINAATPIEAYSPADVTAAEQQDMVEHDWKSYDKRLYAANWHLLFPSSDHRSELTWENRFTRVRTQIETHNFFSRGDDVVSNAEGVNSASVVALLFRQGFDFSLGVWKSQELVKGVNWTVSGASLFMERGQAGWGFDPQWYLVRGTNNSGSIKSVRYPSEAGTTDVPSAALMTTPFFSLFSESALTSSNSTTASNKAGGVKVQYDVLARGIPSKSYAMAANRVGTFGDDHNFDLEVLGRTQNHWSAEGHDGIKRAGRWLHSDFKAVALPYVHQMFEEMITRGALK